MNNKHVILVAGYDMNKTGVSFDLYGTNRMKRLIKTNPELLFTLFDIRAGTVKINAPKHGKRQWKQIEKYEPVTDANYENGYFSRNPEGVLSIVDVYKYVIDIGLHNPATVKEISFFCHGWREGPILVDSNERIEYQNRSERDPNDKDARIKDFIKPNMSSNDITFFRKAFDPNAIIWIWGCSFDFLYKDVLFQITKSSKYRKTPLGKLQDNTTFTFSFTEDQKNKYYFRDPEFFYQKDQRGNYRLTFDISFREIKQFFKRGLENTYFSHIAKASVRKCYGALLGTYASFEKPSNRYSLPLMLIPTKKCYCPFTKENEINNCCNDQKKKNCYCDDFSAWIKFYTTYLNIVLDEEKRFYALYTPLK